MTGKETFTYYTDAGHGWLAAKRKFLQELGIESQISYCSFQRGGTVYLEKDCDMPLFLNAYEAKFGHKPEYTEKYNPNTSIRNCAHFQVSKG